ncbi:phospholipase D-like domain-containing protein [Microbacterium paraoxydans]|uniref:EVE domain-containing protein n=1 Tax=Microbacterium paraoxydans TaxID=199592 RepID=A0ABS5IP40_9MICO|nr:phospholipase D-like domain-containing protein [Microbacterium paraoxydans]MBS0024486.1 EVE domain-containing protein [Microbacterium paraoxydans]
MTSLLTIAEPELMDALRAASDQVRLASPFISIRIAKQLASIARTSTATWSLITRLDAAAAAGGYLSTDGLRSLTDAGVVVRHARRLHAKAYLADETFGMMGSANLTGPGLGASADPNFELSLRLRPDDALAVWTQLDEWWNASAAVSREDIDDLDRRARELPRAIAVEFSPGPDEFNEDISELADLVSDARERSLWVKAQYGQPKYNQWRSEFWFSSAAHRRPSFAPGDLVLIYAKEAHACYAIVEVVDEPRNDPQYIVERGGRPEEEANRWPWVNRTIPRLVPTRERLVRPVDLGFTGQGLQGGHKRIALPEFVAAVRALGGASGLL